MKRHPIRLMALLAACYGFPGHSPPSRADDGPGAEAARAARMIAGEAARWAIRVGDDAGRSSVAGKDPVLRYTNPAVGRVYGNVYLFVAEGRPVAVMSIYKWFSPWTGFEAELQSLATAPLEGLRDGQLAWHPAEPGMTLKDVPAAPRPAASAVERQAQMRTIADGFGARLVDSRVAATGKDQALRRLARPFHRDEPQETSMRDGGLFAFVLGTDPEVFLRLEVATTPGGPRWQYGLARLNGDPLAVTYQGQDVWRAAKVVDRYDPRATYFSKEMPQDPGTP